MTVRHAGRLALTLACAAGLSACATSTAPPSASAATPAAAVSTAKEAVVRLSPASGSLVSGTLNLRPMGDGVHITGEVGGLKAGGSHGFHIHEKGDCSAADASSAGGHFNPTAQPHGRAGQGAHHAGDADNLAADGKGVAKVNAHQSGVTLGGGAANDIAGRAVIVHAQPDDYASQPTGNAGGRIACGIITVTR
ncbi:superoxide dismutase family protein [Thermomonas brevis]